jgi:RNA polymerase-binding transcription factor DksA
MDRIRESIPEEVHPLGEHEIAPSEGVDVDISLATGEETRLRGIDAALDRITEGTFGKCCKCGNEISQARLEAVPDAKYCIGCAGSRHRSWTSIESCNEGRGVIQLNAVAAVAQ